MENNCEHVWIEKEYSPKDNNGTTIAVSGFFNCFECEKCGMRQSQYNHMIEEGLYEKKEMDATINYGSRRKRIEMIEELMEKYNVQDEFYQ